MPMRGAVLSVMAALIGRVIFFVSLSHLVVGLVDEKSASDTIQQRIQLGIDIDDKQHKSAESLSGEVDHLPSIQQSNRGKAKLVSKQNVAAKLHDDQTKHALRRVNTNTEEDDDGEENESDSDDQDQFLYSEDDADPIIDYRGNGTNPGFLFGLNNGPRMVEFYAVWCPHCRHFRDHYIQVARQVKAIVQDNRLQDVEIYAVACNVYRDICRHFQIEGYPQIRLFKAQSTEVAASIKYWEIHAFDVLSLLGIQAKHDFVEKINDHMVKSEGPAFKNDKTENNLLKTNEKGRTKEDTFNDAYLSFDYSLRNGIFMKRGPLSNETATALYDWLELLKRSMPVAWKVIPVVSELLKHFDKIKQSEQDLVAILDQFPLPTKKKWSFSCTHGEKGAGYTCGLWQLFHIMTIGVVEWNLMIYDGDHLILSTEESSRRLRNFIQHFFACNECRFNFVNAYDECAFDRCHRLREADDPDAEHTMKQWMELPLWLFETHNAVNLRLMKEKAARERREWSRQDEIKSQWPSLEDCPRCWREDGAWDDLNMYKYLRTEYWPDDGITNMYRTVLDEPLPVFDDDVVSPPLVPFVLQLVPILTILGLVGTWYFQKMERRHSGRHKRME